MGESEFCRVCSNSSNDTNPLFEGSLRKLLAKIKDITGLQLENLRDLPQNICKTCEKKTLEAHKFRQRCIQAQKRLKELCNKIDDTTLKTKKKRKSKCFKPAAPIEEVICNEAIAFKKETEQLDFNEDVLLLKQEPINVNDNSSNSLNSLTEDDTRDQDMLAIEPETSSPTPKKEDLKTLESKAGEKYKRPEHNFVCDQCGKHYTVKHLFQMHMMRHTGIRPYPCKLCPKGYYATNDLRRHMFKHTGERPYKCKFCELCFNDKSHLLIHTRREHTYERPFACDQCPKTFISSCTFRTHLTTHSGVRAFSCKLCNVSYKRNCHLHRHNRSVMHKQNQEQQKALSNTPIAAEE